MTSLAHACSLLFSYIFVLRALASDAFLALSFGSSALGLSADGGQSRRSGEEFALLQQPSSSGPSRVVFDKSSHLGTEVTKIIRYAALFTTKAVLVGI